MKPSYNEHISKSQGAAQLRVQLITTIYEVLNAKRRHYARVPSLTGRDVLLMNSFVRLPKRFDKLWIVVGRKITESNYKTRNSSQC